MNLPGADRERPNWRRRLGADIAAILASPALEPLKRRGEREAAPARLAG